MYTRFMRNTTFKIVKMFLASPQLTFKMYQIPMEHTVVILIFCKHQLTLLWYVCRAIVESQVQTGIH